MMTGQVPKMNEQPDTTMGALPHILGLLFGFIGPLLVYVLTDDDFVRENASKALSWQVFFLIYSILAFSSTVILFGFFLLPALVAMNIIFPIIAAVKARDGKVWSYPFTLDIVNGRKNRQQRYRNERFRDATNTRESQVQENIEQKSQEERISELKNRYMRGEISEERFNQLLDEELSKDETQNRVNRQYN
jgi:hypothetical protein